MVFSSLFFVCIFLPLNLAAYYIPTKTSVRNIIMLVFSIIFYAWGEPVYVLLLLLMTFACWFFALKIEGLGDGHKKQKKQFLIYACAVSLGLLGIFKYGGFVAENFVSLTGMDAEVTGLPLPIGISFYTFQLLTYVVDVYRGETPAQKKYTDLLLYASLFHQCIAGPIVRYSHIANEINDRKPNIDDFNKGMMRFATGLAKKVLLANNCGSLADTLVLGDSVLANSEMAMQNLETLSNASAITLWFGMLFYMLQIYLDFSAYSDMAIGMGLMTGFHYRENFDYPYISKTVSEFWRRWHISLGSFFRDYVYIPLGGNRKGKFRTILNLLAVWALTGLWHGASWNYVLWGLYFFVFITAEKLFLDKLLKKLPAWANHIYLLVIVYFGWVLFRFEDITLGATVLKGMFCINSNPFATSEAAMYIFSNFFFIIISCLACTPVVKLAKKLIYAYSEKNKYVNMAYTVFRTVIPSLLIIISAISLVGDSYNPFLYFRF